VTQLLWQIVGKKDAKRTVFLNVTQVAQDLSASPALHRGLVRLRNWSQIQLRFERKKPERVSLSGEHTSVDLSLHMNEFIQELVLCVRPGLHISVTEMKTTCQVLWKTGAQATAGNIHQILAKTSTSWAIHRCSCCADHRSLLCRSAHCWQIATRRWCTIDSIKLKNK